VLATLRRYTLGRQEEPQALERIDASIETVEALLERSVSEGELRLRSERTADAQAVG
jgi:N-acyl-D-aspartate/D-glutamate deacylase